jgi:Leucine-rich repeat (LRR) protein
LQRLNLYRNELTTLPEWIGRLTQLQSLELGTNQLTALPDWLCQLSKLRTLSIPANQLATLPNCLGQLTGLQELNLYGNPLAALPDWLHSDQWRGLQLGGLGLTEFPELLRGSRNLNWIRIHNNHLSKLPEWLSELGTLESLDVAGNQLSELPDSLGDLSELTDLDLGSLAGNPLRELPTCIRRLRQLTSLRACYCELQSLPEWIGELKHLKHLRLTDNRLTDLPPSLVQLEHLETLGLEDNPLNPELAMAYKEGLDAVKRYLRAKAESQVVLNEAKLILIGEGEVGKSCLLGALRGDEFIDGRPTTHGIEIKPVNVTDPDTGTEITLNGWDFGGQRVYRPTHQLFFSAPAVYLVVWKPREGPQQGFVKEWIRLVKHREPDAKILVVATHGGPGQRQPDVDRQEIWDLFGRDTVLDFFHVDSKPDEKTGERGGIAELKDAIARVAASLPEMGRTVPARWQYAREALKQKAVAYLPLEQVLDVCRELKMEDDEARDFVRISHRLGHLIHYEHDPVLQDIVVLKPDWLTTAVSFVLDDKQTRETHGLVSFDRLSQLWNDPAREEEFRYPPDLHPVFLRLMERFDLSYRVAGSRDEGQQESTSLVAQLVPDVRPDPVPDWVAKAAEGDEQQVQICQIVETRNGQSATAEGLFYQLIVRLHKYSMGRVNHAESVHWQRGLVVDDDSNGRALLEHVGNDVRITVRAAYPEGFLSVLTHEVKWLVESFWAGLRCDVMVRAVYRAVR